jgi:hypothetical protein
MRRAIGFGVLLVGLALAGCADVTGGTQAGPAASSPVPPSPPGTGLATPPAPGTTATPPAPATSPQPAGPGSPTPGGVLVEFGRQGGLAGLDDQLTVDRDGGFTLVRGRPAVRRAGRLTAGELSGLRRALDQSGFTKLPGVEPASGNDLFTYLVTFSGQRILAQDGGVAEPLKPVIDALTAIVGKYGS